MLKNSHILLFLACSIFAFSQEKPKNSNETHLSLPDKFTIGAYGEINYNQGLRGAVINNGELDVQRLVLLTGYKFNDKVKFFGEIEFEHVNEVFVEQAIIDYDLGNGISARGGLLLAPHGIINEYHEPTTFNGVERPFIDSRIIPTTWREIGVGINGQLPGASSSFQAYIMNGFNSFNGTGTLGGSSGIRGGRQKGAQSFSSAPNLALDYNYFGVKGLNIGLSGYFGTTSSTAYEGIDKNNAQLISQADSTVVGLAMLGVDARYFKKGFEAKGQYYLTTVNDSDSYNAFTGKDIGKQMMGFYVEAAYNLFDKMETSNVLTPFLRYEDWNLHAKTAKIPQNLTYDINATVAGLSFKPHSGVSIKADVQSVKSEAEMDRSNGINFGLGFWF